MSEQLILWTGPLYNGSFIFPSKQIQGIVKKISLSNPGTPPSKTIEKYLQYASSTELLASRGIKKIYYLP